MRPRRDQAECGDFLTRVRQQLEKTQREYYINQQKAIEEELGDAEGRDDLAE